MKNNRTLLCFHNVMIKDLFSSVSQENICRVSKSRGSY